MQPIAAPGLVRRLAARAGDRVADALATRIEARLSSPAPESPAAADDREARDNRHLELVLGWLLRPESNCIDVGANQGRFLAEMVQRAPQGRHLAWEPLPGHAVALRERFPQVGVHQAALADEAGEVEFVSVLDDPGYSGLRERAYPEAYRTERIRVRVERLDDALPPGYVPHFIKVDVEGAELQVFRGAWDTLRRHRPIVAFEHGLGAADRYGTAPEDVWDVLARDAGLHVYDFDARGPLSRDDFATWFNEGRAWNFLALP